MAVVGLVVHPTRADCMDVASSIATWLRGRGHTVVLPDVDAASEGKAVGPQASGGGGGESLDLVVSLGGDGTMLRAVELAGPLGAPVLGVNLGNLGYLTEVEDSGMSAAIGRFMAGDYGVEERMTLEVTVERGGRRGGQPALALNEAAVEKVSSGHTIRLAVSIAGRPFITYAADGLLVATPTGSTAYSLSVHGPIVSPTLRALVVAPVSPHMLFDRSLVLEPSEWVRMELAGPRRAVLVVDGTHTTALDPGDAVVCRPGRRDARLVTFGERDFHAILKAKFGLTDR